MLLTKSFWGLHSWHFCFSPDCCLHANFDLLSLCFRCIYAVHHITSVCLSGCTMKDMWGKFSLANGKNSCREKLHNKKDFEQVNFVTWGSTVIMTKLAFSKVQHSSGPEVVRFFNVDLCTELKRKTNISRPTGPYKAICKRKSEKYMWAILLVLSEEEG